MSTFVGRPADQKPETAKPKPAPKRDAKPEPKPEAKVEQNATQAKTRAELVEEAEALGVTVPKWANKRQIQKMIDEAPVM